MSQQEQAEKIKGIINNYSNYDPLQKNSFTPLLDGLSILSKYNKGEGEELYANDEYLSCYSTLCNDRLHEMTEEDAELLCKLGFSISDIHDGEDAFTLYCNS